MLKGRCHLEHKLCSKIVNSNLGVPVMYGMCNVYRDVAFSISSFEPHTREKEYGVQMVSSGSIEGT